MQIIAFNYALSVEKIEVISIDNLLSFLFKCIYIKNNIGAFIYLTNKNGNNYLNIIFKNYDKDSMSFSNYLTNVIYPIGSFQLTSRTSNLIKFSEKKICFITKVGEDDFNTIENIFDKFI